MKDERLENTIITLHYQQKWSMRKIARELRVSRGRIRRVLVANTIGRATTESDKIAVRKKRPSILDTHKDYIAELLIKYPNITGQRVLEHLKEQGYQGEISIVRDYLRSVRQVGSKEALKMVETAPGQLAAHDWSDYNITFTSAGEKQKVTFFSYILCYSRRQYLSVVENKQQTTLLRELIAAFIYMDGIPRAIRSDNQKACVEQWAPGQPIYNKKYLEFASWYRFEPKTITPRRPLENLKVERPFWYLEQSFLNGREFKDLQDLKAQLSNWLTNVNDLRIHGTTKQRPIDRYQEEHPHLQTLPLNHYDTSNTIQRVVNQESCICWEGYQYVVPPKYMFESCVVRITPTQLIVYSPDGEQIACHPLAEKGQQERYVGKNQKTSKKPLLLFSDVITRLKAISLEMDPYIQQVKQHKPGTWRQQLRNLLTLKVNYHEDDILLAVRRALEYKAFDASHVENFLKNNSEPRYSEKLVLKTNRNPYEEQ